MKSIPRIWLVFAIIFLCLSGVHFFQLGKKIAPFQVSQRPLAQVTVKIAGADVDKPLNDFAEEFNKYLDSYNKSTSKQNRIAGIGYLVASIVSIFSMVLARKSKN